MKKYSIKFVISEELKEEFTQICKEKNVNMSSLLRSFIINWINKNKGEDKNDKKAGNHI